MFANTHWALSVPMNFEAIQPAKPPITIHAKKLISPIFASFVNSDASIARILYRYFPNKKPRTKPRFFLWWSFTTKLEPISKKMFEAKPRHLAGKSARCAPPEKPFAYFLISPAVIFWIWKRVFLVVRVSAKAETGGVALVG